MATKTSLLGLTKPAYTEAADIAVLNTNFDLIDKAVGNGARVYNLLDNSWFVNPVNQRGIASGATVGAYKYCIDRWENYSNTANTLTFNGNGIVFQFNLCQFLNSDTVKAGMVVTAAAKWADGTIQVANGTITKGSGWTWFNSGYNNGRLIGVVDSNGSNYVRIDNTNGDTLVWAALYEGAYTAETLPAYQHKGYAAELAECQRYYRKYPIINLPCVVPDAVGWAVAYLDYADMRVTPTIGCAAVNVYIDKVLYTTINNITARAKPDCELIVETGQNIALHSAGMLRLTNLELFADL